MRSLGALFLAATLIVQATAADADKARFDWFSYEGRESLPPARAGEYRNPILQGFYPDPSVIRVGDDYFLVNSTFAYFPGIPIFQSRNLVDWKQIGNAIDRPEQFEMTGLQVSEGMFAPSISEHAGTWYIVDVCVGCGGNFLITATNPAGPWSKPIFIRGLRDAIDASLFFDEDGSAWIVYNGPPPEKPLYAGHRAIWLQRIDPATGAVTPQRSLLINGGVHAEQQPVWIEGPHIFRKDGFYYLIAAEGGTAENHSEVVLRSRRVTGPYLAGPNNPILTQRDLPQDRPAPITSAGHAQFVQTPQGQWWTVFLATRPYSDNAYNTGRETFLLPVTWSNGWPQVLAPGEAMADAIARPHLPKGAPPPVPTSGAFRILDQFNGRALPPYWMMLRTPHERWFSLERGALELKARSVSIGGRGNPSFLGRRQQHATGAASTVVRFLPLHDGERAGLVAFQNDAYWFFVGLERVRSGLEILVEQRAGPSDPVNGKVIASERFAGRAGAPLYLKTVFRGGAYDFYYGYTPDDWRLLKHDADGTILSTKRAGGFLGATLGPYAYDPTAREQE